jgi:hypothetical protein
MDSFRVQTKRESFLHLPLTGWLPDRKPFPFVYVDISFPVGLIRLGLVRLFLSHVDWMGLEKIVKDFDLFGIETHRIESKTNKPLYGANRLIKLPECP